MSAAAGEREEAQAILLAMATALHAAGHQRAAGILQEAAPVVPDILAGRRVFMDVRGQFSPGARATIPQALYDRLFSPRVPEEALPSAPPTAGTDLFRPTPDVAYNATWALHEAASVAQIDGRADITSIVLRALAQVEALAAGPVPADPQVDLDGVETRAADALRGLTHGDECSHYTCTDCPCDGGEDCSLREDRRVDGPCECWADVDQVLRVDVPAILRETAMLRREVAQLRALADIEPPGAPTACPRCLVFYGARRAAPNTGVCMCAAGDPEAKGLPPFRPSNLVREQAYQAEIDRLCGIVVTVDFTHRWRGTHINGVCLDCDIDGDSFDHRVCPGATGEARDVLHAEIARLHALVHLPATDAPLTVPFPGFMTVVASVVLPVTVLGGSVPTPLPIGAPDPFCSRCLYRHPANADCTGGWRW